MTKRQETLKKQYELLCEKIDQLRQAHAIETAADVRFRLEKQILQAEKEVADLERQLQESGIQDPFASTINQNTVKPVQSALWPAFLVLIVVIGAMVGVGYLSKKALFSLLETYSKDFGIFVIYTGFVGLSLIVAIVMFGILRSTGVFKKTGKEHQYEFGGAMAGFLATLIFLTTSYSHYNPPPTAIEILGNVQLVENGKTVGLVEDANIAVARHPGVGIKTDEHGNFRIELPVSQHLQEVELLVTYQGKTFTHRVQRSEMRNVTIEIDNAQLSEGKEEEVKHAATPSVNIDQKSEGAQSPNIVSNGDVNISY